MTEDVPRIIKVELITESSINTITDVGIAGISVTTVLKTEPCWMDSIVDFLAKDRISYDEKKANRVRRVAPQYWLSAESFGGPYLLCLHPRKVNKFLVELHERVCGGHVGERLLAHRAMT